MPFFNNSGDTCLCPLFQKQIVDMKSLISVPLLLVLIVSMVACKKQERANCSIWELGPPDCTTHVRDRYLGDYKGALRMDTLVRDTVINITPATALWKVEWGTAVFELYHPEAGNFGIKESPVTDLKLLEGSHGKFSANDSLEFTLVLEAEEGRTLLWQFAGKR
jgi:hypothetical protein